MAQFIKSQNGQDGTLVVNLDQVVSISSWDTGSTIDFKLSNGDVVSWYYNSIADKQADLKRIYSLIKV